MLPVQVQRLVSKLVEEISKPKLEVVEKISKPMVDFPGDSVAKHMEIPPLSPSSDFNDDFESDLLRSPAHMKTHSAKDPYAKDPYADPFSKAQVSLNKHDVMTDKIDLNRADEEVVQKAKELMDEDFEQRVLRPGDPGFVYDKRVDFEIVEGPGDWDDASDADEPSVDAGSPLSIGSPLEVGDDISDDAYHFSY